jgi:hypothetical protein
MSVNKSDLTKSIQSRGQYSIVPNEIWNLPLSKHAKIVYIFIISQADTWNPGTRQIAEGTCSSLTTVCNALKELQDHYMLIIDVAPTGLRNVYRITGLSDWCFDTVTGDTTQYQPTVTTDTTQYQYPAKTVSPTDTIRYHIQEEEKKNPIPTEKLVEREILKEKEGIAAKASIPTKEQWDTKEKIRNRQDKTWMIRPYPYV